MINDGYIEEAGGEQEDYIKSLELSIQFLQDELQNLRRQVANSDPNGGAVNNINQKLETINFNSFQKEDDIVLKLHTSYQQVMGLVESEIFIVENNVYHSISNGTLASTLEDQILNLDEEGVINWVMDLKMAQIIPNLNEESGFPTNLIIIPLYVKGLEFGIMLAKTIREKESFTRFELQEIADNADNAASAIQNIRNSKELSGLRNKVKELNSLILDSHSNTTLGWLSELFTKEIDVPLKALKAHIKLLETNFDDRKRRIEIINEQIEKIQLLNSKFSHFFSEEAYSKDRLWYIYELIDEALIFIESQLQQNGIKIEKKYEESNIKVMGNKTQIEQVVLNIIYSACYTIDDGGVIEIGIYPQSNNTVRILIADYTGYGIEEDELDSIFDRLGEESGDSSNRNKMLFLSKKIVESMGGKITISSIYGQGTTFKITLPTAE